MTLIRPLASLLVLLPALWAAPGAAQTTAAPAPTPPASAAPAASWTAEQWQALWNAAQHTAGTTAYEYKWAFFPDIARARVGRISGLRNAAVRTAPNLVAVPKAIRQAMVNLYLPGEKSDPLPYTNRGTAGWVVVELVRTSHATPLAPGPGFEQDARTWVATGLLPAPDTLLTDPLERARMAYWQALTPEAVRALPAQWSPNLEFGNYLTPLTRAVLTERRDLVTALLEHGASLQQCGVLGCVLHVAQGIPDAAKAQEWVKWLLERGAKPDTLDPRHMAASDTPLTTAIFQGQLAVAETLVQGGASVDGAPQARHTPLYEAAVTHRKDTVQWLIARGASVLPWDDRGQPPAGGVAHLYSAALSTDDAEFASWAEKTMLSAALASPQYRFNAFIEQASRRYPLHDGASHTLKAAPFKLVLVLKPGESTGVTVGASFDKAWADEVRRGELRNPMFRPFSSAALAEPPSEDSYDLLVGRPCPAAGATATKPDEPCPGVQFLLQTDASARKDFHEQRAGASEYVREMRRVLDVSTERELAIPLEQFRGKTLQLVLSTALNMGGPDGLRLIAPRFITLKLQ
jgi:hypothetical protein